MKIVSWNVNGIRSIISKGFYEFVEETDPDIICLQEIKANEDQVELSLDKYPTEYGILLKKRVIPERLYFQKLNLIHFF